MCLCWNGVPCTSCVNCVRVALICVQLSRVGLGCVQNTQVVLLHGLVSFQLCRHRYWVPVVAPWWGAEWKCKMCGNLLRAGSSSQTEEPASSDKATAKKLCWKFPDKSLKANIREIGPRNMFWCTFIFEWVTHYSVKQRARLNIREKCINLKHLPN